MKPLKLEMSAFGPYAGIQVIDFRDLQDRTFFLIHGRTGSGKTTILDAICFALYGDTSGKERDGKEMRCHQSSANLPTTVKFDFSVGSQLYRICRSPQQERPRRKGSGVVAEPAQATLWRRKSEANENDDGIVLASQPGKVTEEVERLLNLRSDQFRQVIMLPQGQFRQLLIAESAQRERILEALFKTEIYRRIEEALKEAARDIKQKWADARTRVSVLLDQAGVESQESLEERKLFLEGQLKATGRNLQEARQKYADAVAQLRSAQLAQAKLVEFEEAQKAHALFLDSKNAVDIKRRQLTRAQAAATVSPLESSFKQRQLEVADARLKIAGLAEQCEALKNKAEEARKTLVLEEARKGQLEQLRLEQSRIEELFGKVQQLTDAQLKLTKLEEEEGQIIKAKESLARQMQVLEKNLAAKNEAWKVAEAKAASLEASRLKLESAEKRAAMREALDDCCDRLKEAIWQSQSTQNSLDKSEQELLAERRRLEQLESAWKEGQAAILAANLVAGQPCVVCGSTEHPAPATTAMELPGEVHIEESRALIAHLDSLKEKTLKELASCQNTMSGLQAQVQTMTEALEDDAFVDRSELASRCKQNRLELEDAQKNVLLSKQLRHEFSELESAITQIKQDLTAVEERLSGQQTAKAHLSATVSERSANVPKDLVDQQSISTKLAELNKLVADFELSLKKARLVANTAEQELAACQAALTSTSEHEAQAQERLRLAEYEFAQNLLDSGFARQEDFQAAKLSAAEIANLDGEISVHDNNLAAAVQRLERAQQAALGIQPVNLAELEDISRLLQEQVESFVREESQQRADWQRMESLLADLSSAINDLRQLDREYGSVGRLSQIATGDNERKLTFQRFVLSALLDEVLWSASERLLVMSQGRYRLQRLTGVLDMRKAGGLELEVFDAFTGTTRSVTTLSGGESFLASLSCALGLADVVQSYAGGTHLDTIFIDEGFGSLDPESLDFALRALKDLQNNGRLVGIISHVPELRERIDARLEVYTDAHGSAARICLG